MAEPPVRTFGATPFRSFLLTCLGRIQSIDFSHGDIFGRIDTLDINLVGIVGDADALIDDLKHDVAVDQDSLDYEELTDSNRENIQFDKDCKQNAIDLLQHAPTIEPERKRGKWIYGESEAGNDGYYCSKCGNFVPWKYDEYDIDFIKEFLFCNKCGAEMRNSVETARDIVHEAIDNSKWSDTVDTAKMHKVVDDKYAEIRGGCEC